MSAQDDPSIEVGHYSLDEDKEIPGALDVRKPDRPYAEGTQPPRLSTRDLTQMSAVVGGQAVRKQKPKELRAGNSINPKQATHGDPSDGLSAMELGKQVMTGDPSIRKKDPSGLAGIPTNSKYQEPSQFPKAGSSAVGHIPDAVAGQKIAQPKSSGSTDSGASQKSSIPDVEVGEAISAVVPSVQGKQDAARAAEQDLQNVTQSPSQPDLQRVSEEPVRPGTEAPVTRPTAEQNVSPEASTSRVSTLLGNSLTAQNQPKGGLPQLPKRTGTSKTGRKSKASLPSNKNESRAIAGKGKAKPLRQMRKKDANDGGSLDVEEEESWSEWLTSHSFLAGGIVLAGTAAVTAGLVWRYRRS